MSLRKHTVEILLKGQSGIARKVFASVPIMEQFTESEIIADMARITGTVPAMPVLHACLRDLREAGLIRRRNGRYQRSQVAEYKQPAPCQEEPQDDTPMPEKTPTDPIDLLSGLAENLLALSVSMSEQMQQLAIGIEEAAEQIKQSQAADKAKLEKLQRLQTILHELHKEE